MKATCGRSGPLSLWNASFTEAYSQIIEDGILYNGAIFTFQAKSTNRILDLGFYTSRACL